ncbi:MAG: hypothetical protein RL497_2089, partial [Pseudomonadota bacterium]
MIKKILLTSLISLAATQALAGDNRKNFDTNANGLIEIYDLKDLNALRSLTTDEEIGLYGHKELCVPAGGCVGYELMNDLDFDTNGDGKLDAKDTYWNKGLGWLPINTENFALEFNGNGHVIKNLMINRPNLKNVGLFGIAQGVVFNSLGITGPFVNIRGGKNVGILAGNLNYGTVYSVFTTGYVEGEFVGGLFGQTYSTSIQHVFSTASVIGNVPGPGGI